MLFPQSLLVALLFFALFVVTAWQFPQQGQLSQNRVHDRVVLVAPLQLLVMGGDRFIAANFEAIRLAATAMDLDPQTGEMDSDYLLRSHRSISELNPCHEDNYYIGNALLAWGGAESEANDVLQRAIDCRYWDFLPAFLYGFNQYFFHRNTEVAQGAFEVAAQRSEENAAMLRRLAIMIAVEEMDDEGMALNYLRHQRDNATDEGLREMLGKRVIRLEGLILLRRAQAEFEERFSRALSHPQELIDTGILEQFPQDPLRLGYEFHEGVIRMRQLQIHGVERPK